MAAQVERPADIVPWNRLSAHPRPTGSAQLTLELFTVQRRLAQRPSVQFTETLDYDYVALNQGSSLLKRISDAAHSAGKLLKVRIQVSSFDGICRMIDAGLGIGILPLGSVQPALLESTLTAIPLRDPWAVRTLFVGAASQARLSPEAANLFTFLTSLEDES